MVKAALHEHELAELQKEASKQLKLQKLLEFIQEQEKSKKTASPSAPAARSSADEGVAAYNAAGKDLNRNRKRCPFVA